MVARIVPHPAMCAGESAGGEPMSLINEMLQDLEQRRAPISEASGVPRYVRVLPIARRSRWAWRLLVGAAACAAAAAMIWSLNDRAAARPSPAAHVAAAVVPV